MLDPDLRQAFELFPAYATLHEHLLTTDPRSADPHDLAGPMRWYGELRCICLLHAHQHGDTLCASAALHGELLAMVEHGIRPKTAPEIGITIEDFLGGAT